MYLSCMARLLMGCWMIAGRQLLRQIPEYSEIITDMYT